MNGTQYSILNSTHSKNTEGTDCRLHWHETRFLAHCLFTCAESPSQYTNALSILINSSTDRPMSERTTQRRIWHLNLISNTSTMFDLAWLLAWLGLAAEIKHI